MKLLYVCYWSLADPLTQASVLPGLDVLRSMRTFSNIYLTTIESSGSERVTSEVMEGVEHVPLNSMATGITLLDRGGDYFSFSRTLRKIMAEKEIDLIIARSSMAGTLVLNAAEKFKIPLIVESFEPHAEYMRESDVWRSWDPRYLFQVRMENQQKHRASGLITVANNYKKQLIDEGYDEEKIAVAPCPVDPVQFSFDPETRLLIREKLEIEEGTLVGIYVGKFGGIYWDEEALNLFEELNEMLDQSFHMIILTNQPGLETRLETHGLAPSQFTVRQVSHQEVPDYLSAADIAFATIKSTPNRRFCSAIKIGEYWANGLPIMIPEGIGDDSEIITEEKAGIIIEASTPLKELTSPEELKQLVRPEKREEIAKLAAQNRAIALTKAAYQYQFDRIGKPS